MTPIVINLRRLGAVITLALAALFGTAAAEPEPAMVAVGDLHGDFTAAASDRGMKTLAGLFAASPAGAQEARPLFRSLDPIEITITGPVSEIVRKAAASTDPKPATLKAGDEALSIELSARGNSRRRPDVCKFPPEDFGTSRVRTRYYRGDCALNAPATKEAAHFRSRRGAIENAIRATPGLEKKAAGNAINFLAGFYSDIAGGAAVGNLP